MFNLSYWGYYSPLDRYLITSCLNRITFPLVEMDRQMLHFKIPLKDHLISSIYDQVCSLQRDIICAVCVQLDHPL